MDKPQARLIAFSGWSRDFIPSDRVSLRPIVLIFGPARRITYDK